MKGLLSPFATGLGPRHCVSLSAGHVPSHGQQLSHIAKHAQKHCKVQPCRGPLKRHRAPAGFPLVPASPPPLFPIPEATVRLSGRQPLEKTLHSPRIYAAILCEHDPAQRNRCLRPSPAKVRPALDRSSKPRSTKRLVPHVFVKAYTY